MRALILAMGLMGAVICPQAVQACAVSHRLSDEVLAERARAEGVAWRDATVVFAARITAVGEGGESFTLTRTRTLRGEGAPVLIEQMPEPSPGICLIYHGLNVETGAAVGDEFIIYALGPGSAPDSRILIVSTRMLQDPSTRAALERES